MYIMGIIDRDVRQYLNNVPEMENLLVLKYYSYETHLITDSTIKSIVEQLTRASGSMITQNVVDYLKEEFNIQSDQLYYFSLEALKEVRTRLSSRYRIWMRGRTVIGGSKIISGD